MPDFPAVLHGCGNQEWNTTIIGQVMLSTGAARYYIGNRQPRKQVGYNRRQI
jgi:hypothetical protein